MVYENWMYRRSLTVYTILYTILENAQHFLEYFFFFCYIFFLFFFYFHYDESHRLLILVFDGIVSVLFFTFIFLLFPKIEFYFVLCLLLFIQLQIFDFFSFFLCVTNCVSCVLYTNTHSTVVRHSLSACNKQGVGSTILVH